jgi:acid phosphatase
MSPSGLRIKTSTLFKLTICQSLVTEVLLTSILANFQFFAKKGITLTNINSVTHPSEPNYMSVVGGDYFCLDGDPFTAVPENVSTVVDLLEDKGISWSIYQEDMPYTGFEGFAWVNQKTGSNDYVRKHK